MRITFLTHFPGRGGSSTFLNQLKEFFIGKGHHVAIVCGSDDPTPIIEDYVVVPLRRQKTDRRLEYLKILAATEPDVVYAISGIEEFDVTRFLSVPRVRHIFSVEQHDRFDLPLLIKQAAPYTELFTANTSDVLEDIASFSHPTPVRSQLAPYKVDSLWLKEPVVAPKPSGKDENRPVRICYSARLEPVQKRAHWLEKIIPECERRGLSLEWHIFGAGPCEERIRSIVQSDKNISSNVTFHGWCGAVEMRSQFLKSDLFFLCSKWEGLPVAMLEAMLSGLACVVPNNTGGMRALLKDGDAGWLYDARSPQDAIEILTRVAKAPSAVEHRKKNSRRTALSHFSEHVVIQHLEALERAILELKFNNIREKSILAKSLRAVPISRAIKRRVKAGLSKVFLRRRDPS